MSIWLTNNNYNFKPVTMTEGDQGLMVDTNYNGEYPPKEVYLHHDNITKRAKWAGLKTESRGFHTAILILV